MDDSRATNAARLPWTRDPVVLGSGAAILGAVASMLLVLTRAGLPLVPLMLGYLIVVAVGWRNRGRREPRVAANIVAISTIVCLAVMGTRHVWGQG